MRRGNAFESALTFMGWVLGTYLVSMMAWVLIPWLALGWSPLLITSGSMAPLIQTGDVVLVDPDGHPDPGSVIGFHSDGTVVVHRVLDESGDEALITKGDANILEDSSPVELSSVIGTGKLVVPFIGKLRTAGWAWTSLSMLLAVAAVMQWRRRPMLAAGCALTFTALATLAIASAQFAAANGSSGNSVATVDLAPPSGVTAECGFIGLGRVDVDISWTASTSSGITGYTVYRDPPGGGTDYSEVGSTASTTFTDSIPASLLSLGTHHYVIAADAGPWQSEPSTTDSVVVTQALGIYACTGA